MNENLSLQNFVTYKNDILTNIMDWAVEKIFQRIWLDENWSKPAKGGKHPENKLFEKYRDMSYQVHIFSGTAMAMAIIDYSYDDVIGNMSESELEKKLKRSIMGYLFHDYNKLCNSDYLMENKEVLYHFIDSTFLDISEELQLNKDNIYQIVVCTEKGTSANILDNNLELSPLNFEMNFSRMADILSSTFNKTNIDSIPDIKFGEKILVPGNKIERIKFSNTNLIAISSLVKKSIIVLIENILKGKYLWSDPNTVYYIKGNKDFSDINFEDELRKEFSKNVSEVMKPEKLLNLNDRRVDNSASGFIDQTKESISNFTRDNENLRKCIHLEDIKLDSNEKRASAERFTDFISNYTNSIFSFNYRFIKDREKGYSLRDGLKISDFEEEQIEERIRIFLLRYVQLNKGLKSESAKVVRATIEGEVKEKFKEFSQLLGKEPHKTVLVYPIVLQDTSIDWKNLLEDVLHDLNKEKKNFDYDHVLSRVLPIFGFNRKLPKVPNKYSMSMVNGYPAKDEGKGEKLYGLRTNGFNNRLPTSKIGFGRIDQDSIFEYNIRRNLVPEKKNEDTLIYLRFPGAIPHLDLSNLIRKFITSKKDENNSISKLNLSLDEFGKSHSKRIRNDDSFFLTGNNVNKEKDILDLLLNVLDIAEKTEMLVKVTYSNSPIFEDQLESIRFDISSSILGAFSWNRIRLNEIHKVKRIIETFSVITNGSLTKFNFEDMAEIMFAYVMQPMSIFYYAHKRVFEKDKGKRVTGFGLQFSQRIEEIRKLGYEVERKGDRKMKNVEELAKIASKIVYAKWDMSGSDRTWMIRDSLEALEVMRSKVRDGEKRDISEFWDVIGGTLNTKLRRDTNEGKSSWVPIEEIKKFSDALIKLLKEDYNGKIPSGAAKSYLVNAFEFEYMLTREKEVVKNE